MKKDHAIVIGGSIAGLLAARALSNHFASVTVLERDPLNPKTTSRKGVPQGEHLHILLDKGLKILTHYFPGIIQDMQQADAQSVAIGEEWKWFQFGTWKINESCGMTFYGQHRMQLDQRIRTRLLQLPGVKIQADSAVQGLCYDVARETVTGVQVLHAGQTTEMAADLVIDASGRGSRVIKWLEEKGFAPPPQKMLPINLTYTSRIYQKTDQSRTWRGLFVSQLPALPRGGGVVPIDSQRWMVTLFGYNAPPPTDNDGFLAYAKSLAAPDIYDTLAKATALTKPVQYQYPQGVWQRFDQVGRFPAALLVLGDAMCSVDPVFGQGMTLACKEAFALDGLLGKFSDSDEPQRLRKKYFRTCWQIIALPWLVTHAEALRLETIKGPRPLMIRILQWYTGHVFDLCASHQVVYQAFMDLIHLHAGTEALMRPAVLAKVLARALGWKKK